MWFEEAERFEADQLAVMVRRAVGRELHGVLAPQAVWLPGEARAAANRAIDEEYAKYKRAPAHAELRFEDVADLLTTPEEARYGWSKDVVNGIGLATLVAAGRRFGLIAVREDNEVWIRTFWRDRLSLVLAEVLPRGVGKSPESSISVLLSEIQAFDPETARPARTVARAKYLGSLEPYHIAEFSAEVRLNGDRLSSPHPVRVYDTAEGRWALTVRPHYGDELLTLSPASTEDVADHLDELRRELT